MSITIIQEPKQIFPVYSVNGVNIIAGSTLTGYTNFNYVWDVYTGSTYTGGLAKVIRVKTTPEPNSKFGIFSPARILENYLSYNFNPFITSTIDCNQSVIFYNVYYGEEYSVNIPFTSITNSGGFVRLNCSVNSGVTVNDQITVVMDDTTNNPSYQGTFTATTVSSNNITLNQAYGVATTANETGYISKLLHIQSNVSNKMVYNGVKIYESADTAFQTFRLTGSTSQFLTNYKGRYKIGTNEPHTLSIISSGSSYSKYRINTFSSTGSAIGTFDCDFVTSNIERKDIPTGTWNLKTTTNTNLISGLNENIYVPTVARYDITVYMLTTARSETRTFVVECNDSPYGVTRLAFLGLNGQIEYLSFNKISSYGYKVKRTQFTKPLKYNYSVGDRGATVLSTDLDEEVQLNSDWVEEIEVVLFNELFSSPEVYELDIANQRAIPIVLTSTSFEEKTENADRIFNYKLKYKYAVDKLVQRN
jgi:hypothetical protein